MRSVSPVRRAQSAVAIFAIAASALTGCSLFGDDKESKASTTAPTKPEPSDLITKFDQSVAPAVTVTASTAVKAAPVNGLFASLSAKAPADDVLKPVAPIQVRGWSKTLDPARVKALGARYVMLLSDAWGYPGEKYPNGGGKAPFQDELGWQVRIGEQVRGLQKRPDILFEPLEEPDNPAYFAGTEAQYQRTWLLAYAAVRRELGSDAIMVGPSISKYDPDKITAFLEFCLANGCQVNALSWHEPGETDGEIAAISDHVAEATEKFLKNPRYARLGIREINITAFGTEVHQYSPGRAIQYLSELEAGGAGGASRSCFGAADGKSNCFNDTLDGMIGSKSGKANGTWWVYSAYGESLGGRVTSATTDPELAVLAAGPTPKSTALTVVIGDIGVSKKPQSIVAQVDGLAQVPSLASAAKVSVEIRDVRDSKDGELGESTLLKADVAVTAGTVKFSVPELHAQGAVIVRITPAA